MPLALSPPPPLSVLPIPLQVVDRSFPEDPSDADEIDENGHQVPNIAELWVVQELCNKGDLRASLDVSRRCSFRSPRSLLFIFGYYFTLN